MRILPAAAGGVRVGSLKTGDVFTHASRTYLRVSGRSAAPLQLPCVELATGEWAHLLPDSLVVPHPHAMVVLDHTRVPCCPDTPAIFIQPRDEVSA